MGVTILVVQGAGDMRARDGSIVLVRYLERELANSARILAPAMPGADEDPRYEPWARAIGEHLDGVDGSVQIVGHSFGGSVVLKLLAGEPHRPGLRSLHLIAMPWWGPEGWDWDELAMPDDLAARLPAVPIFLYHSVDDPHVPFSHLARYAALLPSATIRRLPGAEHSFAEGLPELLEDLRAARA